MKRKILVTIQLGRLLQISVLNNFIMTVPTQIAVAISINSIARDEF